MPFRAIHGAKREFMAKPIHDALASIHFLKYHSRPLGHIECDSTYRTLLRISKILQRIYIDACVNTQPSTVISTK